MTLETLYTNMINDLHDYCQKYEDKSSQSVDFAPIFKTRHSNNITLEDWNTLQQYVSNLNSNSEVQDEYLNTLTESLKSLITRLQEYNNELVHKSGDESINGQKVFNGNVEVPTPTTDSSAVNKQYLADNYYDKENTYNRYQVHGKIETYTTKEALTAKIGYASDTSDGLISNHFFKMVKDIYNLLYSGSRDYVDTLNEILKVFESYPVSDNLFAILNRKVNVSDFSNLDATVRNQAFELETFKEETNAKINDLKENGSINEERVNELIDLKIGDFLGGES
jgi:seryl-tRNA synthetase